MFFKQHQAEISFKKNQIFQVLKGIKRKKNKDSKRKTCS